MTRLLLNLLRLVLWFRICSLILNISCAFEKNTYAAVVEKSVLYVQMLYVLTCFLPTFSIAYSEKC